MKFDNKTIQRIIAAAAVVLVVVAAVLFLTGRLDGIFTLDDGVDAVSGISQDNESASESSVLTAPEPSESSVSTAPEPSESSVSTTPEPSESSVSTAPEPSESSVSTAPEPSESSVSTAPEPSESSVSTVPEPPDSSAVSESTSSVEATLCFRNDRLLHQHYEKHGIEMGFSSAEEYERAAAAVPFHPDVLHKTEAEDGDDVYYIESTNEFVIVSTDGYIRTYFNPDRGIDYYNRQ